MRVTDGLDKILKVLKSRFMNHTPLILSHAVTSLCNARCKICDLWKKSSEHENDLHTHEVFDMLRKARNAGIINYTVWGGEPLLRKDLPEILRFAKKEGLITDVITNGYLLEEKRESIAEYTDVLIVSIDAEDSFHDEMRGVEGILERAINGIKAWKNTDTEIIINSVISNLNYDRVEGLVELSKDLGVSISFEPMEIIEGYNEHLELTDEELGKAFSEIIKYKKKNYKILNSLSFLRNFLGENDYQCHFPKLYITVYADGKIDSCAKLEGDWGNIKNKSFQDVFRTSEFKEFCKEAESCNDCNTSCVIESSIAYSMEPRFIIDKIKNLGSVDFLF